MKFKTFVVVGLVLGFIVGSAMGAINIKIGTDDSGQGWFGPSTGSILVNGKAYDATFSNLVTAVSFENAKVELQSLNITCTDTLFPASGVHLIGHGNSTVLYLGDAVNKNIMNVTHPNVVIENIRFDVNNGSQTMLPTTISAVYFDVGSFNCTVRGCSFYRGSYSLIGSASTSLQGKHTIENNYINGKQTTGFGAGITMRSSDNIIKNNRIKDTYAAGIVLEAGSFCTRNLVDGNICWGDMSVGIYMEGGSSSGNATIVNNIVYSVNGTAYGGSPDGIGILASSDCVVSDNLIYSPYRDGINTEDHCTVSDNRVYDHFLSNGINTGDFCIISGNEVNNDAWGAVNTPDYGIRCGNSCIITENNISGSNGIQIEFGIQSTGDFLDVSHNQISGCLYGIRVGGDHNKINDNIFINTGLSNNPAVFLNEANFTDVSHNQIYGSTRGIRLYKSCNCTVVANTLKVSGSTYSIYEDTVICSDNHIDKNNYEECTTKTATLIGTGSYELLVNATASTFGIHTSSGTVWK